jgi:hypothetical protein
MTLARFSRAAGGTECDMGHFPDILAHGSTILSGFPCRASGILPQSPLLGK